MLLTPLCVKLASTRCNKNVCMIISCGLAPTGSQDMVILVHMFGSNCPKSFLRLPRCFYIVKSLSFLVMSFYLILSEPEIISIYVACSKTDSHL